MAKLLTIISLILALLLFPPAALALISNNAVPGDRTYPIKRGLEDVIFSVASINPVSKAWFSAARSDRRFREINILVTNGKKADQTLSELVTQTQTTADQIASVSDQTQKEKLVEQLSQSIDKYDKGLEQLSNQPTTNPTSPTSNPTAQPTSIPITSAIPSSTPRPSPTSQPTQTSRPTSTPRPTQVPSQIPTQVPTQTPTQQPTPIPTPQPGKPSPCDKITDPIQHARCELQRIKGELGTQSFEEGKGKENEKIKSNEKEKQNQKEEHSNSSRDRVR